MKKCKLLHINDGNPNEIQNGGFMHIEDFPKSEEILSKWLQEGWEVKHIVSEVSPGSGEGFAFYKDGLTFYMEKDFPDEE